MGSTVGVLSGLVILAAPLFGVTDPYALTAAAGADANQGQKYQCLPGYIYKVSPGGASQSKVTVSKGGDQSTCTVLYCDAGGENCKRISSHLAFTAEQHADWGYIPSLCPTVINCDGNAAQKADLALTRSVTYAQQLPPTNITSQTLFPTLYGETPAPQTNTSAPQGDAFSQIQSFSDRWSVDQAPPPAPNPALSQALEVKAADLRGLQGPTSELQAPVPVSADGTPLPVSYVPPQQQQTFSGQVVDSVQTQWHTSGLPEALQNLGLATVEHILVPVADYFGPHTDSAPPTIEVDTGSLSPEYLARVNEPFPAIDPGVAEEARQTQQQYADLMHPAPAPVQQTGPKTFFGSVISWLTGHGF